jgi:hypothetical protein
MQLSNEFDLGWFPTWSTKFLFTYLYIINLLKYSTFFEHYPTHLQDVYVVIVYMQPLVSSLSADRPLEDEQGNARNM